MSDFAQKTFRSTVNWRTHLQRLRLDLELTQPTFSNRRRFSSTLDVISNVTSTILSGLLNALSFQTTRVLNIIITFTTIIIIIANIQKTYFQNACIIVRKLRSFHNFLLYKAERDIQRNVELSRTSKNSNALCKNAFSLSEIRTQRAHFFVVVFLLHTSSERRLHLLCSNERWARDECRSCRSPCTRADCGSSEKALAFLQSLSFCQNLSFLQAIINFVRSLLLGLADRQLIVCFLMTLCVLKTAAGIQKVLASNLNSMMRVFRRNANYALYSCR